MAPMAEYQREIKENPTNAAEAYYRIGVLSNQLGNTEGAVEQFRAALQANPLQAEARKTMAAFYVNRGAAIQTGRKPITDLAFPIFTKGNRMKRNGRLTRRYGNTWLPVGVTWRGK